MTPEEKKQDDEHDAREADAGWEIANGASKDVQPAVRLNEV